MTWATMVAIGLAVLAGACSGQNASAPGFAARDSAGVMIVENRGDVWSAPELWHVSPDAEVRIGTAEGDEPYLLDGVRGVAVLGDGGIVVANSGDATLRWYDAGGVFLFQRGGEGEGPGEFSRLGGIALGEADTMIAVDWSARRLTRFTPAGGLAGTSPITGLTGPPGTVYPLPDGSLVMGISGFSTAQLGDDIQAGRYRLPSPLLRLAPDGSRADTVGMFPGQEIEISTADGGLRIGMATLGKGFAYAVHGDRIYVGTQDRFEIDLYSRDGQIERSIRAPDFDAAVDQGFRAEYDDWLRSRLDEVPPDQRAEAERSIADIELPESRPAYSTLLVDSDGNLWVADYEFDLGTPERWVVFDREGRLLTAVSMPTGFRPMWITTDRIFGRSTDDLGVQQVVVRSIVR